MPIEKSDQFIFYIYLGTLTTPMETWDPSNDTPAQNNCFWQTTHLEKMLVKLDHFPKFRDDL